MADHMQQNYGNTLKIKVSAELNVADLTDEQFLRLQHHLRISERVFEESARSMLKGVRKYGPEPEADRSAWVAGGSLVTNHWLPHIFSEAVDSANQTGLFADALGVEL